MFSLSIVIIVKNSIIIYYFPKLARTPWMGEEGDEVFITIKQMNNSDLNKVKKFNFQQQ